MISHKPHTLFGIITLGIGLIFLLAGLWPFNFFPQNRVERKLNKEGLRVQKFGMAYSNGFFGDGTPLNSGAITIELDLACNSLPNNHIANIITLFMPKNSANFSVSQWKTDILIRQLEFKGNNRQGEYHEFSIDHVLTVGTRQYLTISSDSSGIRVYLNGQFKRRLFNYIFSGDMENGDLFLGNSPTGENQWEGEFYSLAFYEQALSASAVNEHYRKWLNQSDPLVFKPEKPKIYYHFDGKSNSNQNENGRLNNLYIPKTYQVGKKTFFSNPIDDFRITRGYFGDMAVNLAGFIPFGYFLLGYLYTFTNRRSTFSDGNALLTIICGFGISFAIEFTQAFLPDRNSSLTDLINNTIGTVIGVFLFKFSIPWLTSRNYLK